VKHRDVSTMGYMMHQGEPWVEMGYHMHPACLPEWVKIPVADMVQVSLAFLRSISIGIVSFPIVLLFHSLLAFAFFR